MAVWAPRRFGARAFWHPKCFVCVECGELLVDLIHFAHAQNIFCGRHHAELIKPRCSNCDELIFSEECTEAEGRVWHMRHFCCVRCAVPLGGQRYVMNSAEAQPTCVPCCRESAKFSCATCGNKIVADRPHIAQGDFHWHADERCFCCSDCERALLGKAFSLLESNGRLFCALRGCSTFKHRPKNLPLPPPAFPPPPPPAVHRRQFPPIPPPRVRFDLRRRTKTPPATSTENVYETVAAAAPPPVPSTSSGCSANGSMSSSAGKYFVPEASESLDAEETPETPVRRCRSVDGRSERRSKCVKNKSANKKGPIAIGNLYSGAPPPNARGEMPSGNGDGGSLAAALALASSGSSRRRKRRQRRRGNFRRQQLLYWESPNSLSSADDSDSSLSSCSSSSSSDGDELNPQQRNVLLNRYLHTLATRSEGASVAGSPASGKSVPAVCRIATTRPTTAKCANNAKDRRGANAGGNCRIS
uniref:LIM zinc-binding domain-containing protein n=1 Tax=Globodera pallida TaxID=36090 RepID=A0A183BXS9_GLOPA